MPEFGTARMAGAVGGVLFALCGLLIAAFGVALAFFLNGVSFVAVLVALVAIRTEGRPDAGRLGIREGVLGALSYAA
ncbi:MAG TPA: hypothetical protein VKJ07_06410, partial [Mycobacteriales bacterium]|nr:hypothetical protein [Mycobacteriales bacterium]